MTEEGLQFRADFAKAIERELETSLEQKLPPLEEVLQSSSASPKLARAGVKYFTSVIGLFYSRQNGTLKHRKRTDIRNRVIERLASELSTKLSNDIVEVSNIEISKSSQSELQKSEEDRIQTDFTLKKGWRDEVEFIIKFKGVEIRRIKMAFLIEVELVIKKIVLLVQRLPAPKIQPLSFQDAEADLKLSDENNRFSVRLKINLK